MTNDEKMQLLAEQPKLCPGVLKRIGISPQSPDYEDYLQIAREAFLGVCDTYRGTLEQLPRSFYGYVFKKMEWTVRDALRKNQFPYEYLTDEVFEVGVELPLDLDLAVQEQLRQILPLLTPDERVLLLDLLLHDLTFTELARKYQVSRKTLYARRNRIGLKFAKLFGKG